MFLFLHCLSCRAFERAVLVLLCVLLGSRCFSGWGCVLAVCVRSCDVIV